MAGRALRLSLATGLLALPLGERGALAQERTRNFAMLQRSVDAPRTALEFRASAGYSQGVGSLDAGNGQTVQDVAGVGGGIDVGIGFRVSPHFYFGTYATGALYTSVAPDTSVSTLAGGIEATWHFRPYRSLDPWISLGVGYRGFWETPPGQGTTVWQGFEIGRMGVGVDYRLSSSIALGPTIVTDLTYFQKRANASAPQGFIGGAVSAFVSAGVGVRFDFLGQTEARNVAAR
jgi:hypothetical protein